MTDWSEDVRVKAYLAVILGDAAPPTVDGDGYAAIWCPLRKHQDARVHVSTGSWQCVGCRIRGNLALYEQYRSSCNLWMAEKRIREAVALFRRREHERLRQAGAQARALVAQLGLHPAAGTLLRLICLCPGIDGGRLRRGSHLRRSRFRDALRDLRTHGLICTERSASTAGRYRSRYYPQASLLTVRATGSEL